MPWAVPETVSPGKLMFDGVSLVKTTSEAPGIPGHPQTHRGGLQLDQNGGPVCARCGTAGSPEVDWQFTLVMAAYDFVRLPNCSPFRAVSPWTSTRHCQVGRF